MHILELRLKANDLAAMRTFYAGTLHLPVLEETDEELTLETGNTRLVFEREAGWQGKYHFAFDVPENQIEQAKVWISTRTPLATLNGQDVFSLAGWNSQQVYFYDPAGNILEFIARHNQPNASTRPFDEQNILSVSEIGLATDDVPGTVEAICTTLGIDVYDGAGSDTFTAVGDENGLFIVVKRGRIWYPETGIPATLNPVKAMLLNTAWEVFEMPELPYYLHGIRS